MVHYTFGWFRSDISGVKLSTDGRWFERDREKGGIGRVIESEDKINNKKRLTSEDIHVIDADCASKSPYLDNEKYNQDKKSDHKYVLLLY